MKTNRVLFYFLLLVSAGQALAQTPVLIKDISPGTVRSIASDNAAESLPEIP